MRLLRAILGWAGFGALVAYALAWAFAAFLTPDRWNPVTLGQNPSWASWVVEAPSSWPAPIPEGAEDYHTLKYAGRIEAEAFVGPGVRGMTLRDSDEFSPSFAVTEYLHGWPWPATRVVFLSRPRPSGGWTGWGHSLEFFFPHPSVWYGGLGLGLSSGPQLNEPGLDYHRLGLRPSWPGLLGDSLFFGAAGALAFHALSALRRWFNPGPGRCRGCGRTPSRRSPCASRTTPSPASMRWCYPPSMILR